MSVGLDSISACAFCYISPPKENPKGTLLVCSKCRVVSYCSKECQKLAWPIHKKLCSKGAPVAIEKHQSPKPIENVQKIAEDIMLSRLKHILKTHRENKGSLPVKEEIHGIKGHEEELTQLLKSNEMTKVVNCIRKESDFDITILWLERQIDIVIHPILYLELSKAILKRLAVFPLPRYGRFLATRTLTYLFLGLILAKADVACSNCASARSALDACSLAYSLTEKDADLLVPFKLKNPMIDVESALLLKNRLKYLIKHPELLGDPSWVDSHSLSSLIGSKAFKPKSDWANIRVDVLEKALETINDLYKVKKPKPAQK